MLRRLVPGVSTPRRAVVAGSSEIGARQLWFAGSIVLALVLIGAVATPSAMMNMLPMPTYLPMFSASMVIINFMLAALLIIKGTIGEDGDSIRLGAAYFYVCCIIVPQTASFPGGIMPIPLIGVAGSPVWIWCFWHAGFAVAIIYYAVCAGQPVMKRASAIQCILAVLAATGIATVVATTGAPFLPPFLADGHTLFSGTTLAVPVTVLALTFIALVAVARLRAQTPEQLWLAVGLVASCFDVWLTWHGTTRFSLGWYLSKAESLLASIMVLTSLLHDITRLYHDAATSNLALSVLARKDGLTGVTNRRGFDEKLEQEFRRARREELPVGLVLLDVDCFKNYNDRYGHQAGDDCLRRICQAAANTVRRPGDEVARYGGEEIAVVLPSTEQIGVEAMADQIRAAVLALHIEHLGSPFGIVTVSAGASSTIPIAGGVTPADLISAADAGLYRAKAEGRNRVCGQALWAAVAMEQIGA